MLIKPNWKIFKAKFSENQQDNFEWFCYLLFSKEYNQPYGIHRYKNQSGIETDPIEVNGEVIGWQSKFYEESLSNHKEDLLGMLIKTKRDNPNITKIILYTNSEWGQGRGTKEPQAKIDTEEKAKELNIDLDWRTRSYFESPFVCQEQREISRYFFERDTKWELTNNGFLDTIKSKYESDFKTISLLTNDKKPIDDIFINQTIIRDKYTLVLKLKRIKWTTSEKQLILKDCNYQWKENRTKIDIKELINISDKSLTSAKAGIGKTTLCKYIAYKWAKRELYQKFEYIIYLPLREWRNRGVKGAIKDYYYSLDEKELNIDFKDYKILFLFDGYDELNSDKKKDLRDEIDKYALSHYIITTRPYGYQKSDFRVDEYFETIGFTDENVEKYIDAFFKENNDKAKSLKAYLKTNINIKHIGYIPLMLEMICSQWEKEGVQKSLTMTKLYQKVIEDLLSVYARKKGYETVYKKKYKSEIETYLGSIAFQALKKQTIVINGAFLEKSLKKIKTDDEDNFLEQSIFYTGFLKSDNSNEDPWKNTYQFPHLTFQEYFSALYVSKLESKEQKEIIQKWKFYPHMQMFFAFLGGLIEDKEFLFNEIESELKELVANYIPELKYICALEINHIKLFEFFLEYLESIDRQSFKSENLIKKITFSPKFDTSLFEKVVEKVKDEYILVILAKNNLDISLKLIDLVEKDTYKYESLIPYLANIEVYDEKYIDRVFEFIKNITSKLYSTENLESFLKNLYLLDTGSVDFEEKLLKLIDSIEDVSCKYKLALLESFAKVKKVEGFHFLFVLFLKNHIRDIKSEYISILLNFIKLNNSEDILKILNSHLISLDAKLSIYKYLIKIEKQNDFINKVVKLLLDNNLKQINILDIIKFDSDCQCDISQKLFDFCMDDKTSLKNRRLIAYNLFFLKSVDKKKILSSIQDKKLDTQLKKAFLYSLVRLDSVNYQEIKDVFYVIQEENVSYQRYFIDEFIYFLQKENSHINLIKYFLLKKSIDDTIKLEILHNIKEYDKYNDLVKELLCSNRMSINMKYKLVIEYAHNKSIIKEFCVLLVKILRNKKIDRDIRKNVCSYLKKVSKNINRFFTLLIEEKEELKNNWLNSYEINSQYINKLLDVVGDDIIDSVLITILEKDIRDILGLETKCKKIILNEDIENGFKFSPENRAKSFLLELNNGQITNENILERLVELVEENGLVVSDSEINNIKSEIIKILDYLVDRCHTKLKEILKKRIVPDLKIENIQIKLIHKYENPIIKKDKFLYSRVETKLLFKFYDEEQDRLYIEAIKWKLRFSKQTFYIKDDKLNTIENGKEIHTQRALTAKEIEILTTIQNKMKKETL